MSCDFWLWGNCRLQCPLFKLNHLPPFNLTEDIIRISSPRTKNCHYQRYTYSYYLSSFISKVRNDVVICSPLFCRIKIRVHGSKFVGGKAQLLWFVCCWGLKPPRACSLSINRLAAEGHFGGSAIIWTKGYHFRRYLNEMHKGFEYKSFYFIFKNTRRCNCSRTFKYSFLVFHLFFDSSISVAAK